MRDPAAPAGELVASLRQVARDLWVAARLGRAVGEGVPVMATYVGDDDIARLRHAGVEAPAVLLTVKAWIAVPNGSFEDYVRSLPASRRSIPVRDRAAFSRAGLTLLTFALLLTASCAAFSVKMRRFRDDVSRVFVPREVAVEAGAPRDQHARPVKHA